MAVIVALKHVLFNRCKSYPCHVHCCTCILLQTLAFDLRNDVKLAGFYPLESDALLN